ncbi:MAG: hypothetical protein JTT17_06700 [Candidatus Brockarchaeota archaeon]|nr:hypothetical protein [Candidatus Brockarchaeota archaeon]
MVRAGIDSISVNPDAAVFTRKLVASIEQRIMLEKALGKVRVDPDWDLPDPDHVLGLYVIGRADPETSQLGKNNHSR